MKNAAAFAWETNSAAAFWFSGNIGEGAERASLGHVPPHGLHDDVCCGVSRTGLRKNLRGGKWIPVAQVHGRDVLVVDEQTHEPSVGDDSPRADALVTTASEVNLMIATADCGPVALFSDEVVGAVHAGWRGLFAGVIPSAANEMKQLGARKVSAVIGPCICATCYEFDDAEQLGEFVQRWGSGVATQTADGKPAFDLRAAIASECVQSGIEVLNWGPGAGSIACTSCSGEFFSYRARKDAGRQAMIVWRKSDQGRH